MAISRDFKQSSCLFTPARHTFNCGDLMREAVCDLGAKLWNMVQS